MAMLSLLHLFLHFGLECRIGLLVELLAVGVGRGATARVEAGWVCVCVCVCEIEKRGCVCLCMFFFSLLQKTGCLSLTSGAALPLFSCSFFFWSFNVHVPIHTHRHTHTHSHTIGMYVLPALVPVEDWFVEDSAGSGVVTKGCLPLRLEHTQKKGLVINPAMCACVCV